MDPTPQSPSLLHGGSLSRRAALFGLGMGLGNVALSALLGERATGGEGRASPLAPKPPHVPARARACIFLLMEGGPSHIDTFDPKPKLAALHLREFTRNDAMQSAMSSGKRYYVQSPFRFRKAGQSGADMATNWEYLARHADDLCFYRGCQVDSVNHPSALYQLNTGNRFGGDPALGAWITYGLGSENSDLPGFVVLPELAHPQGGASNWGNGFLPAHYQATPLRPRGAAILDLEPPPGVSRDHQRENLDLLARLNARHSADRPGRDDLTARIESHELAFRMQRAIPEILDLNQEDPLTRALYGIGEEPTDAFGRKCLLARRLVERGVRFVQLYAGTWDSHDDIA